MTDDIIHDTAETDPQEQAEPLRACRPNVARLHAILDGMSLAYLGPLCKARQGLFGVIETLVAKGDKDLAAQAAGVYSAMDESFSVISGELSEARGVLEIHATLSEAEGPVQ